MWNLDIRKQSVKNLLLYLTAKDQDHIIVETDHQPLLKLYSPMAHELPSIIYRWALRLQEFPFEIRYTPGKDNIAERLISEAVFLVLQG